MKKLTIIRKLLFSFFVLGIAIAAVQVCNAQRPVTDTSPLYRISNNSEVLGAYSKLVRTTDGITLTLHTSDLPRGAYTVWWVIENHPEFCTERPCTLDDENIPAVQSSLVNASGRVVGKLGNGNFGAWLGVGDTGNRQVLFGPGLVNPMGADVYLVVRYHGPVVPELMPAQINFFEICAPSGCSDEQIGFHIAQ